MSMTLKASPNLQVEHLRKGRRLYGSFVTYEDGRRLYVAYRKHDQIYRAGRKTISEAIRAGVAAWALDVDTLAEARARGCRAVAVMLRDTGDRYITKIDNFYDPTLSSVMNNTRRGGSLQRTLPLSYWKLQPGKLRL